MHICNNQSRESAGTSNAAGADAGAAVESAALAAAVAAGAGRSSKKRSQSSRIPKSKFSRALLTCRRHKSNSRPRIAGLYHPSIVKLRLEV